MITVFLLTAVLQTVPQPVLQVFGEYAAAEDCLNVKKMLETSAEKLPPFMCMQVVVQDSTALPKRKEGVKLQQEMFEKLYPEDKAMHINGTT